MPTFALLLFASVLVTSARADDEVTASDVADSREVFTRIGKAYLVAKDNGYMTKAALFFNLRLARFTPRPTTKCSPECKDAIALPARREFVVEAVVAPDDERKDVRLTCRANSMFCHYRVRFTDGQVAYVEVHTFEESVSPSTAIALDMPGLYSIRPKVATAASRKHQVELDRHFRKIGIKPGFTMAEVLRSDWGKPEFKTSGNGRTAVWAYRTRMVSFIDGVVHEIKPLD
ncbi:hypothetical protein WDL1P1_00264 (plasmid) [Variovorax sp. WDL1]|uniref:hypothetical protein n=1 Tax=Variovorax sp. WDL1 TaxID=207745 RepID=UPI000CB83468|nr:hypothetical protein [Variovorax sp. WDL1]PNG51094.1 hypothetical protein CHC07_05750 [Variovorax sp. B4]VTU42394.1 hypothetical protein SRS16P1_00259 [Variovorax sp. SRS16]VTU42422.1 hypothetical protein E5P1_00257 [Variovorax sp. PBL-E5]VTU44101.1 hypothetical protein H6P1_00672 [Variovorax sp. PBL-H6]VTV17285.1 hypothetical protein WDL1P1_00264 [Variovorax sp. WDL1]